jgi:hypothetical protein
VTFNVNTEFSWSDTTTQTLSTSEVKEFGATVNVPPGACYRLWVAVRLHRCIQPCCLTSSCARCLSGRATTSHASVSSSAVCLLRCLCRVVLVCVLQNQVTDGIVNIVSQAPVTKGGVLMWFKDRLIDSATGKDIVLPTPYSSNTKTLAQCMAQGADHDTCSDGDAGYFPNGGLKQFLPMYAGFVNDYLAVAQLHGYQMPQYYQSHYNSNGLFTKYDTITVHGYGSKNWIEVLDPQSAICQVRRGDLKDTDAPTRMMGKVVSHTAGPPILSTLQRQSHHGAERPVSSEDLSVCLMPVCVCVLWLVLADQPLTSLSGLRWHCSGRTPVALTVAAHGVGKH